MTVDWNEFNYAKDLQFDFDSLEIEAADHPSLAMKYAEEKSRLGKSVSLAKENVSIIKGRLTKEIIKSASKKPTIAEIEAELNEEPDYRQAVEDLIELEYEYGLLQDACRSLNSKKEMIQETIKMLQMNYFNRVSSTNGYRRDLRDDDGMDEAVEAKKKYSRRRRQN